MLGLNFVDMTITEKILARAAKKNWTKPGEIITVAVDWCMTNDATTHVSIDIFNDKLNTKKIYDPDRTIFVIDHNVPSESIKTTQVQNKMRKFAKDYNIKLHDGEGICHQILLEKYVLPGQIVVAADSHTCSMGAIGAFGTGVGSTDFVGVMVTGKTWLKVPETIKFELEGQFAQGVYARDLILKIIGDIKTDGATYMAMEFGGPAIRKFTVDDRIVLCNLAVEAGAKNGIVEPDEVIEQYFKRIGRCYDKNMFFKSDTNCKYEKKHNYNLSILEPAIVSPHQVDNYDVVVKIEKDNIFIDQGFIGSCNNGRIEELRIASKILKNKKVKPKIKLIISPASRTVFLQALEEGLVEIFLNSGAIVLNPNCSVCWGACQAVLGEGEVMISTGTRNFKGRAGSPDSYIYLGSSATVAASCVAGKIVDPRNLIK